MREIRNDESMLSIEEAEERARKGAEELEELINRFNDNPGENEARHEDLTSHFMSLLAETYGIASPAHAVSGDLG